MKRIVCVIILVLLPMLLMGSTSSCDVPAAAPQGAKDVAKLEQQNQAENQMGLYQKQPPPKMDWSLERDNLSKRMLRWNDPNKLSYIYLIAETGTIMAFFPIKGKVSSVNSSLTGSEQIVKDPNMYREYGSGGYAISESLLMESPDYDGSYGDNGEAIFFFLTDGTYMEWAGNYLLCDQPVKLSQEPIMIYDVSKEQP